MSKIYGYARCSTNEDKQDINRQIRELKAAGAEEVIFEYEHGDSAVKQNLQMLLETAAEEVGHAVVASQSLTVEVDPENTHTSQLILDAVAECLAEAEK